MNRQQRRAEMKRSGGVLPGASPALDAMIALGVQHYQAGRLTEAGQVCRQILAANPGHAASLHLLGVIEHQMGNFEIAARHIKRAVAENNRVPVYQLSLGNALLELGQLADAANCFRRAVALQPDFAEAYCRLGAALTEMNRPEEGERYCRQALRMKPDLVSAQVALAGALESQKRLDEAAAALRRALATRPSVPEWEENLSYILLAQGEFTEGWALAESRLSTVGGRKAFKTDPRHTRWRGEDLTGASIVVRHEQGFGDIIQFCRFIPRLMQQGADVVVEVPAPLVRLLGTLPGAPRIIGTGGAMPDTDFMVPMMSLPFALNIGAGPFWDGAYLAAPSDEQDAWAARLGAKRAGLRVGLAWSGNPAMWEDVIRSIDPRLLQPFFSIPGVEFVNLQKGGTAPLADWPLIDLTADLSDFADSAALMMNLDLIITVDTAVVHLAGALGKPVWLMDRFNACWRWMTGRRDSPWYPTLRIYRQPRPGDWGSVVDEITRDLRGENPQFGG